MNVVSWLHSEDMLSYESTQIGREGTVWGVLCELNEWSIIVIGELQVISCHHVSDMIGVYDKAMRVLNTKKYQA